MYPAWSFDAGMIRFEFTLESIDLRDQKNRALKPGRGFCIYEFIKLPGTGEE